MGRKEEMRWEPAPAFRWYRTFKKRMYRVTCAALGLPRHSWDNKANSVALANAWWRAKEAELVAAPPTRRDETLATLQGYIGSASSDELPGFLETKALLESMPPWTADLKQLPADRHVIRANAELLEMHGATIPGDIPAEILSQTLGQQRVSSVRNTATEGEVTIGQALQRWHDLKLPEWSATTLREVQDFMKEFKDMKDTDGRTVLFGDWGVTRINEAMIEDLFLTLRDNYMKPLGDVARKKRWQRLRQFIKYLSGKKLIEQPRNLWDFSISVPKKTPKVIQVEKARSVLKDLKPRFRLYALLGINCSMNPVDIGHLTKSMVDWERGILRKKRVKTSSEENVPVVSYKLWPETLELLREMQDTKHPELVLTNLHGTPLYSHRVVNRKPVINAPIIQQWTDAKTGMVLTDWRDLGANLVYKHPLFRTLNQLYLGHAPSGVNHVHYLDPPEDILDDALEYVRGVLLEGKPVITKMEQVGGNGGSGSKVAKRPKRHGASSKPSKPK